MNYRNFIKSMLTNTATAIIAKEKARKMNSCSFILGTHPAGDTTVSDSAVTVYPG